ncbi:hypothetical protein [Flavobacterium sp.]|uniref:LA_2272 family surface repeat-containing protein n=1 Tax=Flavobacterium sp. TaxID=239 RepID=UPI001B440C40|nr:hypothetical protein [Flavobacterium sp.]MBP6127759.1 hypothetical protein [Flavobacterium sp.]
MKKIITILTLIISINSVGQKNYLSIGNATNGLCFGNSTQFNGVRFNVIDKNCFKNNGFNLSLISESQLTNGVNLGLLSATHELVNGINIGGLFSSGSFNGMSITGFMSMSSKINGIGISGINSGDTLNGLMIGLWTIYANKAINGLAISTFFVHAQQLSGVSFTLLKNEFTIQKGLSFSLFNDAKELHGVQIGLINYAGNNRRFLRWTPLINFNFK